MTSPSGGSMTPLSYADVLRARRDGKGRRVREVWVEWAMTQPDPKPSWLVPYDELSEADKEADRCIGSALWGDGYMQGVNMGLEMAYGLTSAKQPSGRPAIGRCIDRECPKAGVDHVHEPTQPSGRPDGGAS